jgi:beta-N-acetylhexosaminidase
MPPALWWWKRKDSLNDPLSKHAPLILDVAGLDPQPRRRPPPPAHPLTGGVILFGRNWKDRAQVSALCAEIKDPCAADLLICVDHEGGRVQRFRTDGFTHLPPMRAWASCG